MPKVIFKYAFILNIFILLLQANSSILSISSVCTNPIEINASIVIVCNDIDFNDRKKNHLVQLLEIDKNLKVSHTVKLDINYSDIGKIVKVNNKHAYLLGETTSKCIQVLDLNLKEYKVKKMLYHCGTAPLFFPFEGHNLTLLLEDNSLLFPIVLKQLNETVVQIMYVNNKKHKEVISLEEYKGYVPIAFEKFHNKSVLLLRSKENPFNSVLLSFVQKTDGSMSYSVLYKTTDFTIMTLTNINDKVYISGNAFLNDYIYFGLYEIVSNGSLYAHLNNVPMSFFPAFISYDTNLTVIGVTRGRDKKTMAVTSHIVDRNLELGIKLDTIDIVPSTDYPLILIDGENPGFLLRGKTAYILFPKSKIKLPLQFSNISSNMLYPNLFHFLDSKYVFYIIKDNEEYKSIIEKLQ